MRLIDADELIKDIKEFWDYKTVDGITARTVLSQTITDITNVPTVKAIPILKLQRWLNKQDMPYKDYVIGVVEHLIECWEKENETNR